MDNLSFCFHFFKINMDNSVYHQKFHSSPEAVLTHSNNMDNTSNCLSTLSRSNGHFLLLPQRLHSSPSSGLDTFYLWIWTILISVYPLPLMCFSISSPYERSWHILLETYSGLTHHWINTWPAIWMSTLTSSLRHGHLCTSLYISKSMAAGLTHLCDYQRLE